MRNRDDYSIYSSWLRDGNTSNPDVIPVSLDFAFQAQPFADGVANPNLSLSTMDFAFQAQPFVPYGGQ